MRVTTVDRPSSYPSRIRAERPAIAPSTLSTVRDAGLRSSEIMGTGKLVGAFKRHPVNGRSQLSAESAYLGSLYAALNVPVNASSSRIRAAFAEAAFSLLRAGEESPATALTRAQIALVACDVLLDPKSRNAYDALLARGEAPPILHSHLPSISMLAEATHVALQDLAQRSAEMGQTDRDIIRSLVRRGCNRDTAASIATKAVASHRQAISQHSTSLIVTGLAITAAAAFLNFKIFGYLVDHKVPLLLVIYGPILFGVGLVAKGVFQLVSKKFEEV